MRRLYLMIIARSNMDDLSKHQDKFDAPQNGIIASRVEHKDLNL